MTKKDFAMQKPCVPIAVGASVLRIKSSSSSAAHHLSGMRMVSMNWSVVPAPIAWRRLSGLHSLRTKSFSIMSANKNL
ncbi:MAG TPA: hypothetical protein VG347_21805 [Verrucomicrobiae bacterium]|nr:hypothetical protein [Verrucomicrobiae bacterium]